MKKILVLVFFVVSLFGFDNDFLSPDEAFKVSIDKKESGLKINVELPKSIYLYDEFLKVVLLPQNIDITKELKLPNPETYDGFIVHFNGLNIDVPYALIKEKIGDESYELQFNYQGCSKAGLCYSPMSQSIKMDGIDSSSIKATTEIVEKITTDK
ncbi:MAG: protein-disulfide reductase DsbD N-terminal domain-containing protein, partial [Arcobacteraceae bacterium]